ncbi:hypothetical protein [Archaeoglobus sp.]
MRFAIVSFGLKDVVDEILPFYPQAEVFNSLDDLNVGDYDFIVLTSELGGVEGERLISAIESIACEELVIFCTTATSLNGILRSRSQAFEIVNKLPTFDGAILSGFLKFEDKVEALKMIIDDKIDHLASK